jgi:trehalose 6-phosphate phosphatase
MKEAQVLTRLREHVQAGGRMWLFIDYDGTLVPIAPTPDQALPDSDLLSLLGELAQAPALRPAIVSGRALVTLQALLPVQGLVLAGTYGIEVQIGGEIVVRGSALAELRPHVEHVMTEWLALVDGRTGFLIEDKGLAVALHARWADADEAERVLPAALAVAQVEAGDKELRILGGDRFLEVAPGIAHKGRAVAWLMERLPLPDALPVYFGDDDKDEEAFAVVSGAGGVPIIVGERLPHSRAAARLPGPEVVRAWLRALLDAQRIRPAAG